MTTDRSDLRAALSGDLLDNLLDDLADEVLARDPAYLRAFPARIGDRAALAAHLAPAGLDAPDILDAVEEGVAVLAGRGVPVLRDGFDPVGESLVAGIVDAVLAGRGQLDLRPEPREGRAATALLAEAFQERRVAGRRVFVSRRTEGTPLLVVGALGVPVDLWRPLLADQDVPFRPILVELSAGSLTEGGLSSSDGLEAHAAALAEVLRALDLGPVVALGWCNGGRIVLDLARRCDLVAGVVLLSPTLRGGDPASCGGAAPSPYEENFETAYRRVRANPAFAGPLSRMLSQLFAAVDWGAIPDPARRARAFLGRPRAARAGAVGRPTATAAGLMHQAARTARDEAYPLRETLLAGRPVPILAVLGECDGVVSNAETLDRLAVRDDLAAVAIAGAGHYVGDLQYRYLRLALTRFLAAPRAPATDGSLRMTCARRGAPPEWSYRPGEGAPRGRRYPLAEVFAPAAALRGEAPACADSTTTLTFAGLERGARRLARRLRDQGVAPGRHVVVLAEKRAVMPLVAAAIWKADGVYVPVDASSPPARLAAILARTTPAAILGSARALAALGGLAEAGGVPATSFEAVLALAADASAAEAFAAQAAPGPERGSPEADEDRPAYVMFTSGSTGTPKGVVIPHRALLDYFFNHNQVLRLSPSSRVFSLAPFHFDVSIEDTILPLSLGAFVRQYDGIPLGPPMRRTLRRDRTTHLIAVSSLLQLITGDGAEIDEAQFPDLGMVMTGAEVADPRLIDLWVARLPRARVINAYGPTEATIVCMTHTIGAPEPGRQGTHPIGAPLPRVLARLVDEDGAPLSGPGATGELLIGGSQVMTGYLGMEEATRASLVAIDGERYYRTRDICRLDAEGRYVFVERADDMVKVGGRRIHLGEIRHHATALPGVERVALGLVTAPDGHAVLGLVAVVAGPDAPDEARIRAGLAAQLTAATMPALVAVTTVGRLTATGKTDEKGLLAAVLGAGPPAEPPPSPTALESVPA